MQGMKFTKKLRNSDTRSKRQRIVDWKSYWGLREVSAKIRLISKLSPSFFTDDRAIENIAANIEAFKTRQKLFDTPVYDYSITLSRPDIHPIDFQYNFRVSAGFHGLIRYSEFKKQFKLAKEDFQSKIHTIRVTRARLIKVARSFYSARGGDNCNFNLIGGVHEFPETILNIMLAKQAAKLFEYKAPISTDNNKYVGVEIEFFCKVDKKNLAAELFKTGLGDSVRVMTDGSIKDYPSSYYPHEVTILAPENQYVDIITRTCAVLNKVGAKVNTSCGMHVHLDMRNRNKEAAYNNLVTAQPILFAMNPKSRSQSTFCKINKSKVFNVNSPDGRYNGINAQAYTKHKTLEIRIHAGTVNETKIINWVKLLLAVVGKDEVIKRGPRTFKTFVKSFGLDYDMATYIAQRIEKFHNNDVADTDEVVAA